jgi:phage shock protein PspC (stress-responsive transcriptional regulator)
MAAAHLGHEHSAMAKTEDPTATTTAARILRRRVSDRVIGGVAGGLGDYFEVDPLLLRIAFVGLMIFGGAGLVLYVIAWLLIPSDGQERSVVEGVIHRAGQIPSRFLWIAVSIIAIVVLIGPFRGEDLTLGSGPFGIPGAIWALVVIVGGIALLRRRDSSPPVAAATAVEGVAAVAQPVTTERPAPRPRSPLTWYTLGACFVLVGVLAAVSRIMGIEVTPGQYFGLALIGLAAGLIVGGWWGRARILMLFVILLAPLAGIASFLTAPLEGGVGNVQVAPATIAELQTEYRLLAGELDLDLTQLPVGSGEYAISASVGTGQLVVLVPEGVSLEIRSEVGAGASTILGPTNVGTRLDGLWVRPYPIHASYVLDLEVGIGRILVMTYSAEAN